MHTLVHLTLKSQNASSLMNSIFDFQKAYFQLSKLAFSFESMNFAFFFNVLCGKINRDTTAIWCPVAALVCFPTLTTLDPNQHFKIFSNQNCVPQPRKKT